MVATIKLEYLKFYIVLIKLFSIVTLSMSVLLSFEKHHNGILFLPVGNLFVVFPTLLS